MRSEQEQGAGLSEIYVLRTASAAAIWLLLAPPRSVPLRTVPVMSLRAGLISLYFALVILAVERGNPGSGLIVVSACRAPTRPGSSRAAKTTAGRGESACAVATVAALACVSSSKTSAAVTAIVATEASSRRPIRGEKRQA